MGSYKMKTVLEQVFLRGLLELSGYKRMRHGSRRAVWIVTRG